MNPADPQKHPLRPRFPDQPEERAILQQRAHQLAKPKQTPLQTINQEQLLHVRLEANAHYGIPYRFIDAIIPAREITPIPLTPPVIAGVINRHGQLLTIIDIKYLLTGTSLTVNKDTRILIVHDATITTGVLVEHVEGKVLYEPDKLTASLQTASSDLQTMIVGIHQGYMTVLNMDALLAHPTVSVGKKNKNQ